VSAKAKSPLKLLEAIITILVRLSITAKAQDADSLRNPAIMVWLNDVDSMLTEAMNAVAALRAALKAKHGGGR
jgi:hypothetical protein